MIFAQGLKGEKMARYGDPDYDDMIYYLDEFLKNHEVSELLKLVTDAVDDKEWSEGRE